MPLISGYKLENFGFNHWGGGLNFILNGQSILNKLCLNYTFCNTKTQTKHKLDKFLGQHPKNS